jgi:opacity protein-like surface antigen
MKKQLLCLCAIASFGLAATAAESESEKGFYVKFDAGVAFQSDVTVKKAGTVSFPSTATGAEIADFLDSNFGIFLDELNPDATYRISKPKFTTDAGLRLDLDAGYRFNKSWAVELETGFIYNSISSVQVTVSSNGVPHTGKVNNPDVSLYQVPILANVIYTVPLDGKVKPYVGAGVGGVWTMVDGSGTSESAFAFGWQAMAGADYQINDKWSAGLAYKLLGTGECDWGGVKTDSFLTHSIVAVVSYKF